MIKLLNIPTENVIKDRFFYRIIVIYWILLNCIFWGWWINPNHIINLPIFILLSLSLLYEFTFLPSAYIFFLGRMEIPAKVEALKNLKVAIISPCVPSKESISVIEKQIINIKAVSYPHDSWILDEENNEDVKKLCQRYGVKHFTRCGIPKWNQKKPPFQEKTKAGNVNAWLSYYGKNYDFFTQLDIDHNPKKEYLDEVLGYFKDPKIAWVQAPSIYKNFKYWTARGSSEQEFVLQGPLQMGFFGFSKTPFIIGSHTTYRTKAILKIGGFQPTRAEDHLDTLVLSANGYQGIFLPKIIAEGDGPESFEIYLKQQFAWAYSMIQILFKYTPQYLKKLKFKQIIQFLFAQTWYPFWSLNTALLFAMPIFALILNLPLAKIPFLLFIITFLPIQILNFLVYLWSKKWFLPRNINLSWRGIILQIARWPVVFLAFFNVILGIKKPYMITPKGRKAKFSLLSYRPYLILTSLSLFSAIFYLIKFGKGWAEGYLIFVLWGALIFLLTVSIAIALEFKSFVVTIKNKILPIVVILIFSFIFIGTTIATSPSIIEAVLWIPTVNPPPKILEEAVKEKKEKSNNMENKVNISINKNININLKNNEEKSFDVEIKKSTNVNNAKFPEKKIIFGAYDPEMRFKNIKLDLGHDFVSWEKDDGYTLIKAINAITNQKRFPIISWEPWLGPNTLEDVIEGKYDEKIIRPAAIAIKSLSPQIVIIRLAHEMDLQDIYPWSIPWENGKWQNPEKYIAFWRHIVDIFRQEGVNNVWWLWSSSGNKGIEVFYPGDEYVDFVGLTVFSFVRWGAKPFEKLLDEKWPNISKFNKPVIIAELGIAGAEIEKEKWLIEAGNTLSTNLKKYPLLKGVLYFNNVNVQNTLTGKNPPDWRIEEKIFEKFLKKIEGAKTE